MAALIKLANRTGYRMKHISSQAVCGRGTWISNEIPVGTGDASGSVEGSLNGKSRHIPKMKLVKFICWSK